MFSENQQVAFAKQLIVLSTIVKNKTITNLNEIRDRNINTLSFILVHSIPKATSSR